MLIIRQDHTLEMLLDLDGYTVVLGGGFWVKMEAKKVKSNTGKPFGIKYSLTLHNPDGTRILGFDNAHAKPGSSKKEPHDHIHRGKIKPYAYANAEGLLKDFWQEVEAAMKKEGAKL